jgi:tetratricopeptide (TPR) repeat protein
MADLSYLIALFAYDPDDEHARAALEPAARAARGDERVTRFEAGRKTLAARGRPDAMVALIDVELGVETDVPRVADLLLEKAMLLDSELLDVAAARATFARVLELRPQDELAREGLNELDIAASNWQKFASKYVQEASASTDRSLASGLYVSAAECYVRFAPAAPEAEAFLRRALEIEPKHAKAGFHLARLLRAHERWKELGELYDARGEHAATVEEKVASLLALHELANGPIGNGPRAERAIRRALSLDPAHPRALRVLTDAAAAANDWPAVVAMYQAALRARRDEDPGMLLQVAMALRKYSSAWS